MYVKLIQYLKNRVLLKIPKKHSVFRNNQIFYSIDMTLI